MVLAAWSPSGVDHDDGDDDSDDDGGLFRCIIALRILQSVAQAAELQQWWLQYFSVEVWRGMKQLFTVVGQAKFVCLHHRNSISGILWW